MKQHFTPEDLIAYVYAETSINRRLTIKDAARRDPLLAQEIEQLRQSKQQFPKVKFSASKQSLQKILNYSCSTALEGQC